MNGDGTYNITTPDGNTIKNVTPGDNGNLPDGKGSFVINNHNIIIIEPNGAHLTINFGNGGNTTNTTGNGGNTTNTTGNGNTGDNNITTTTPQGGTATDGDTNGTSNSSDQGGAVAGGNTGTGASATDTEGGTVTNGSSAATSTEGGTAVKSSPLATSNGANGTVDVQDNNSVTNNHDLPQTGEQPVERAVVLGLLGTLVSLLGFVEEKERRNNL